MEEKQLKFIRLRHFPEDLIGYVTRYDEHIVIERPLRVDIETYMDMEDSRQILTLQEYIPQSIVDLQEMEILLNDISLIVPVREEFFNQYESASEFFYFEKLKSKTSVATTNEEGSESTQDKLKKVVSILEAMANKKDKPVH